MVTMGITFNTFKLQQSNLHLYQLDDNTEKTLYSYTATSLLLWVFDVTKLYLCLKHRLRIVFIWIGLKSWRKQMELQTKVTIKLTFIICLIHSDCYNKMPQTRQHINNRNLLLSFLEIGSPRPRWLHGHILLKAFFLFIVSSHCDLTLWKGWEISQASFIRVLISLWGLCPNDLITAQRPNFLILLISH